uniref:Uncharacterized protein n=1 Tax=Chelonoidis abingdonii TaxID=106734 RepID=A0A8C0HD65_CHEAB
KLHNIVSKQNTKKEIQNGSIHQKDAVNDDDFEPYLSSQTNQVKRAAYNKYN